MPHDQLQGRASIKTPQQKEFLTPNVRNDDKLAHDAANVKPFFAHMTEVEVERRNTLQLLHPQEDCTEHQQDSRTTTAMYYSFPYMSQLGTDYRRPLPPGVEERIGIGNMIVAAEAVRLRVAELRREREVERRRRMGETRDTDSDDDAGGANNAAATGSGNAS